MIAPPVAPPRPPVVAPPGGGVPLPSDGSSLPPPRPPGPVVTPPDSHFTPGGPVGGPGVPPRATLDGIASEVGRIESKLNRMMREQEDGGDQWQDLIDAIRDLLGGDGETVGGTVYRIQPPCGRAADGGALPPVEITIPTADGATAAIVTRLDAIARLVDEHKQIRQPICKGKPTGEPVTVTFTEVGT